MIEVRPEQPSKALDLILVTEFGIVIEVRPEQPEKAELPILVTELGIVIEVRPTHDAKAAAAIPFVPPFTTIIVFVGIVPLYLYRTRPA